MGEVYKTIDKLLEERNITGTKLCADLGMSRSFLTELRKGRTKGLNAETAQRIANYFGVSTDYLLGLDDEEMISVEGLTRQQRRLVEELVRMLQEKT